ncbi:hypothetical protein A9Q99_05940 [Gammaproteobacteria bacterium 45_16_T64]|nr:hypothetical protein A9Q99_05940 [Gammaproteobacteria bacterium 45_16_T64]
MGLIYNLDIVSKIYVQLVDNTEKRFVVFIAILRPILRKTGNRQGCCQSNETVAVNLSRL